MYSLYVLYVLDMCEWKREKEGETREREERKRERDRGARERGESERREIERRERGGGREREVNERCCR